MSSTESEEKPLIDSDAIPETMKGMNIDEIADRFDDNFVRVANGRANEPVIYAVTSIHPTNFTEFFDPHSPSYRYEEVRLFRAPVLCRK